MPLDKIKKGKMLYKERTPGCIATLSRAMKNKCSSYRVFCIDISNFFTVLIYLAEWLFFDGSVAAHWA